MITILNSKLLVPNISETITRSRFHDILEEVSRKKVTTVIAPAGYGKTTLVAQAVQNSNWKSLWYRLETSDQDLVNFLSYLIAGVRKISAKFGTQTLQRIEKLKNPQTEWLEVISLLINEIEAENFNRFYLIFEDFHHVQEDNSIIQLLDFFIDHLPPRIHLIIISRAVPKISLSKLRAARELVEIKTEDLAFTESETDSLCQSLFGKSFNSEELKILQRKTEGWITGLILFYYVEKGNDFQKVESKIKTLKGSSTVISNYLQENAFKGLDEYVRNFLVQTSILPDLQVDFCNRFLAINKSREILTQLNQSRLFTFVLDDERECFCYHQLFKDFLQKKLEQESDPTSIIDLQLKAAELYEQSGQIENALNRYLAAEDFENSCRLLNALIVQWKNAGQIHLITSYLDKIPLCYLQKQSWYLPTQAFLASITIDFKKAIDLWKTIYEQAKRQNSHAQLHKALLAIGFLFFESGNLKQSESYLKKLLVKKDIEEYVRMHALRTLVLATAELKKTSIADDYFVEFKNSLKKLDISPKAKEILLLYVEGRKILSTDDYSNALINGEKILRLGFEPEVHTEVFSSYIGVSQVHFYLGNYKKGFSVIQDGLQLLEKTGYHTVVPRALFLHELAANSLGLGKVEAGITYLEETLRFFSQVNPSRYRASAHRMLGIAYNILGNNSLAEEHFQDALKFINDPYLNLIIRFQLAHLNIEQEKHRDVQLFIDELCANSKHTPLIQPHLLMLQAHRNYAIGNKKSALSAFSDSLKFAEKLDQRPAVPEFSKWAVPLVIETYAKGNHLSIIKKFSNSLVGSWALKELKSISKNKNSSIKKTVNEFISRLPKTPKEGLKIRFLGQFNLFVGNREIPNNRWRNQKAKTLLKYLVFKRNTGYILKEVLMELLWPGENPQKTANRFHVAMATVRKTLEPHIFRGTPSSYIQREGDGYCITLGDGGYVDFEEFLSLMKRARQEKDSTKILHYLEQAESIYRGDFLREDLYTEWCNQPRETLKNEYLFLLSWKMEYYEKRKDFTSAIYFAEKYLSIDCYAEDVYRRLMILHWHNGTQEKIKDVFDTCKKYLVDDLDCPISIETENVFRQVNQPIKRSLP